MHYDKLYPASYKYIKLFYIITSIALLFGQAKRASRERASEGRGARGVSPCASRIRPLACALLRDSFHSPK